MQNSYLPQRAFHAAFGLAIDELDVMLLESDRSIRTVMHKMLSELGVKKLRSPRSVEDAFWAMKQMPANVLIADQDTTPIDGISLVRRMRAVDSGVMAFIPAILTARKTTNTLVEMAIASGVNQLLNKPFSPRLLTTKFRQLASDSRCFVLKGDRYVIEQAEQAHFG